MTVFFVSDTHFDHANIIRLAKRPFFKFDEYGYHMYTDDGKIRVDLEAMNEKIIADWNAVVKPDDIVYHLGDFSWDRKNPAKHFDRLNGKKHFIEGNHDPIATRALGWVSRHNYAEIEVEKQNIVLFHYPITDWNGRFHGAWHLFGHIHDNTVPSIPFSKSLEVGLDHLSKLNDRTGIQIMNPNHLWAPISFEQLKVYFDWLSAQSAADFNKKCDEAIKELENG